MMIINIMIQNLLFTIINMEGRKVRITKITDSVFGGSHPNQINEGYARVGYAKKEPTKGEVYFLNSTMSDWFRTSIVTEELNEESLFKTQNSTYKLEYLD